MRRSVRHLFTPELGTLDLLTLTAACTLMLASTATLLAQTRAADVVDRASLRAFVDEAADDAVWCVAGARDEAACLDERYRREGRWRAGNIYLYVIDDDGNTIFHALQPELEGQNFLDYRDSDGVPVMQELIAAAHTGDFVEYRQDNPLVEGDEERGSPKVGYARYIPIVSIPENPLPIIGSGFYPAQPVPALPSAAAAWGMIAMAFVGLGYAGVRFHQAVQLAQVRVTEGIDEPRGDRGTKA